MRSADLAMYRAKSEGKGRYALYEPSMHERVLERLELKADLQRAVVADEFAVHYQPIVTLQSGRIVGVEALVRWNHPERGLVLPVDFIALAEETGLILPLGRYVLNEACRAGARLATSGGTRDLGVSVNISAKQLASANLAWRGRRRARRVGRSNPSALTLEITESTLLDSPIVVGRLEELRRHSACRSRSTTSGPAIRRSTTFAASRSTRSRSRSAFVDELGTSPEQDRLVAAILRLGATMGLDTVAEGIEVEPQRDRLRVLKCRYGQGYLYSRPVPADELDSMLVSARTSRSAILSSCVASQARRTWRWFARSRSPELRRVVERRRLPSQRSSPGMRPFSCFIRPSVPAGSGRRIPRRLRPDPEDLGRLGDGPRAAPAGGADLRLDQRYCAAIDGLAAAALLRRGRGGARRVARRLRRRIPDEDQDRPAVLALVSVRRLQPDATSGRGVAGARG